MSDICRLCLSVSSQIMYTFSENSEILCKLRESLSIIIPLNECLPNSVCSECFNKVKEFSFFHKAVTENQHRLNQHLENGIVSLDNFYLSLRKGLDVKEEIEAESIILYYIKSEDEKSSISIKQEDTYCEDSQSNCSDELSLSLKKVEEKSHTAKNKVKPRKANAKRVPKTAKKLTHVATYKMVNENKNAAKDIKKTDVKRKCLTCFDIFESRQDLFAHYTKEHSKNVVKDEFDYSKLAVIPKKNGLVSYKCDQCDKVYYIKRDIKRHMVSHSELRPYVCNICGKHFKTATMILNHGRAHGDTVIYECMYECGYKTTYRTGLKKHERDIHRKDEFKYKCDKCGQGYHVKAHFDEHDNIHTGAKPFICDICGMAFHYSRYLTTHRRGVHKLVSDPSILKRYVCDQCSLVCDSWISLYRHLKNVHGLRKKSYVCDYCGKSLTTKRALVEHERVHTGEKPFSCSTCNKSFSKRNYLIEHERVHTGVRPYTCEQCGMGLTQRSALVRHMRQHAGSSKESNNSKKK